MARGSKSQWEFGNELFSPTDIVRKAETVSELTLQLKRQIEGSFVDRRVAGEVSNYRLQSSGHAYFVLKDAAAQLSCVLFRGQGGSGRAALKEGAQVVLTGDLTVYEVRGNYQLRVSDVEVAGVGALQAAFERLKVRLAAEGLFDSNRKRMIPKFPLQIGLVTSPTGAAIRDVLHVLQRRFSPMILLEPVRVQGSTAASEIAAAIGRLNRYAAQGGRVDLILVTRGGGSIVDLWCFNEECVARAIVSSAVPVISAVGHEIDFTIADFAADLRAATPSAAAEILSEHYVASRGFIQESGNRLLAAIEAELRLAEDDLNRLRRRLLRMHPRRRLEERAQRLDEAIDALKQALLRNLKERRRDLAGRHQRLSAVRPAVRLRGWRLSLDGVIQRLSLLPAAELERQRRALKALEARLRLLSPQSVLDRGYSLTFDAITGKLVRDSTVVGTGTLLQTRLARGEITSVVTETKKVES